MEIIVKDQSELISAAKQIIDNNPNERVFLFYGNMGAGKTTFIKSLCDVLGVHDDTSSPTFSIVNEYSSENGNIYHFDFYRLKSESEAFDMGYEEYLYSGDYCFIEWPEKIVNLLPLHYTKIEIQTTDYQSRKIIVSKK